MFIILCLVLYLTSTSCSGLKCFLGFVAEEQTYQVRVMIRIHKKSMQSGDFVGMLGDQNALCNDQNALHCGGALL